MHRRWDLPSSTTKILWIHSDEKWFHALVPRKNAKACPELGIHKQTYSAHHKSHIDTDKHKDKRELFEIKLSKMSLDDLKQKYKTGKVIDIVNETETVLHTPKNKKLKDR